MRLNREAVSKTGERNGITYEIDTRDERVIDAYGGNATSNRIENLLDAFEDGYNELEEIDGEWYESIDDGFVKITRKAYNVRG